MMTDTITHTYCAISGKKVPLVSVILKILAQSNPKVILSKQNIGRFLHNSELQQKMLENYTISVITVFFKIISELKSALFYKDSSSCLACCTCVLSVLFKTLLW